MTKKLSPIFAMLAMALTIPLQAATPRRVATFPLPANIHSRFDHLALDAHGNRLFLTAESMHEVLVLNAKTGRLEHTIAGIGIPHSVYYRAANHRIFVTDGGAGEVRIYNGDTYQQTGAVKLKVDSDSIAYDAATHRLFVVNGGGDAHETSSMVSVVDTGKDAKVGEIKVDGDTLEQLVVDPSSQRLYVANPSKSEIDVINRSNDTVTAHWPLTMGSKCVSVGLDAVHHRLFTGCRSGVIVVVDTQSGKELQTLPIGKGIDDLAFDASTDRIIAPCGSGSLFIYEEQAPNHYQKVAELTTGRGAKNIVIDVHTGRLYTVVPPHAGQAGEVQVYQVLHS